jgi:hypothetical protein
VWRWYRPNGPATLDEIAETVTTAVLKMVRP